MARLWALVSGVFTKSTCSAQSPTKIHHKRPDMLQGQKLRPQLTALGPGEWGIYKVYMQRSVSNKNTSQEAGHAPRTSNRRRENQSGSRKLELNHANIIDVLAENSKKEYLHFCNLKKSQLQEIFRPCDQFSDEIGLVTLYGSFLIGDANYKHLWEVMKICLVLSHGNATVEGGFSVNKSLLVENMHENTVTAQRHIHDEIQEAGGIKNIHISKKMLDYVRGSRKHYHEYLEMKKAEKRKLDIQIMGSSNWMAKCRKNMKNDPNKWREYLQKDRRRKMEARKKRLKLMNVCSLKKEKKTS
uniref:(California timema) hypothetical protein n=1 Tax=Timema californicum TaxID=61474 RepID=A0A7R9JB50_TIMCA|nr:unnamed protein product [Timema californicum]